MTICLSIIHKEDCSDWMVVWPFVAQACALVWSLSDHCLFIVVFIWIMNDDKFCAKMILLIIQCVLVHWWQWTTDCKPDQNETHCEGYIVCTHSVQWSWHKAWYRLKCILHSEWLCTTSSSAVLFRGDRRRMVIDCLHFYYNI